MKVFGFATSLLALSTCEAFSPFYNGVHPLTTTRMTNQVLKAETLEGWKIDGKIKPVNNFILIKKAEDQKQTETGILLSKTAKIVKTEGTVVDVGPGKLHPDSGRPFPMPVEEGDSVIYGKYDGTELKIDGYTHSLIRDDDILIKFKGGQLTEENVEVVNDCVLVFVETRETETSGGLVLATGSDDQKRPSTGVVVKVGPGRMASNGDLIPMSVDVGDSVKFMDFAGNEIKIGEKEYSVVKMPEILAKF
mmetsp:Transcript_13111/g.24641  ORF Transcript_13111/g.24641 Transcript_13111/m.24641 type:complete len:249 (-) Transcript_13111:50-796(-)